MSKRWSADVRLDDATGTEYFRYRRSALLYRAMMRYAVRGAGGHMEFWLYDQKTKRRRPKDRP